MVDRGSGATEGIPKWKIALAVGAPVAVGLVGLWWYKRQRTRKSGNGSGSSSSGPVSVEDIPDGAPEEPGNPLQQAQASKAKGNKYFKGGRYDQAIACYTEAIEVCPVEHKQEMATFYQNRAAAYEQLKNQPQVVADCTKALEYNNKYTKALFRRAKACEQTGDYMQCLEDVTAVCILESFENQQSLLMADRVLKELGRTKAKANYTTRGPVEPSRQFIRTYFSTFHNDPLQQEVEEVRKKKEEPKEVRSDNADEEDEEKEKGRDETPEKEKIELEEGGDVAEQKLSPYQKAIEDMAAQKYANIVKLCSKEIADTTSPNLAKAYLLRATFYHLRGAGHDASEDLKQLMLLKNVDTRVRSNALIKSGSLKMQDGKQGEALEDFQKAAVEDPDNSDIYHHRGQLNLLIDQVTDAVQDFEKCVKLSPDFAVAHVQKCYTEYRAAFTQRNPVMLQQAMASFETSLKKFPDCAEGYALYGQALTDQQRFEEADKNFSSALKLEPDNGNFYVHKGLLQLQWKQDVARASDLINQALKVDDKCEFAYETLGTIEVQRGQLAHAIELFNKAINLARTEIEMAHLYSLLDAAIAQSRVAKNFGIQVPLGPMTGAPM